MLEAQDSVGNRKDKKASTWDQCREITEPRNAKGPQQSFDTGYMLHTLEYHCIRYSGWLARSCQRVNTIWN